ncbi:MAG TPA: hypothetical protein PKX00_17465 [Opitutaceae bacterium]|jgi:hypothetical protein|nr:hypothetical protein [Opitutaceae bacterium]
MATSPLRAWLLLLGVWLSPATALLGAPERKTDAIAPPEGFKEPRWVFSLLPKSMQKDPRLDYTVITEMTPAGRKLPPVTKDNPAYYELYSAGFRQLGDAPGEEKTLTAEQLEPLLVRSLEGNGFRPAKRPEHEPSLLILYTWGSHNRLVEGDDENPSLSSDRLARNLLERAALVGGDAFARELLQLLRDADTQAAAAAVPTPPGGRPVFDPGMLEFANPVSLFRSKSNRNAFLLDQTSDSVYYLVASAYDYRSATTPKKTLLWRTRMTVSTQGVSQIQTLPTLVQAGATYFGRDMKESAILSKRTVREGTVEIGAPTVISTEEPK